jgi:putative FmdB family regulatory protein
MPMYDYRCRKCGKVFEELVASSTVPDSEIQCPHCKAKEADRLLSAPSIALKTSVTPQSDYACRTNPGFT